MGTIFMVYGSLMSFLRSCSILVSCFPYTGLEVNKKGKVRSLESQFFKFQIQIRQLVQAMLPSLHQLPDDDEKAIKLQ